MENWKSFNGFKNQEKREAQAEYGGELLSKHPGYDLLAEEMGGISYNLRGMSTAELYYSLCDVFALGFERGYTCAKRNNRKKRKTKRNDS